MPKVFAARANFDWTRRIALRTMHGLCKITDSVDHMIFRTSTVLLLLAGGLAQAGTLPLDGYAAIVNDRVITVGEVMAYVQPTEQQISDIYGGDELRSRREAVYASGLEALIDRALILEDFEKSGAAIPDRLVNDRINEIIFSRFNNDRAAFERALIEQQVTQEEWRDEIRDRLVVSFLRRQEVTDKVKVSPFEVRRAYDSQLDKYKTPEEIRLRVLVLHKGATQEDRDVKAQEAVVLRGRILAGEDFAEVAKARSEGMKASEGGDWGWVEPKNLREELRQVVETIQIGDVSDVIEAGDELYILRVEEKKAAGFVPYETVRQTIEDELKQTEAARLYKAWIDRLRNKHYVQIF